MLFDKDLDVSTGNKVSGQYNVKAVKQITYLGVDASSVVTNDYLMLDGAGWPGQAEERLICPFAGGIGNYYGAFCNKISTHEGEEVMLRGAFLQLRQSVPRLKLIVAPRHPDRAEEVHRLFMRDPFQVVFYSSLPQKGFDVAVVDEFGVLGSLYEFGDLAYVGGSLVPKGGQNPVEPAAAGKPVLFGPDMSDFPHIADLMLKEGGAIRVKSGEELAAQANHLLSDKALSASLGAKNRALVERNSGVTLKIVNDILECFLKT